MDGRRRALALGAGSAVVLLAAIDAYVVVAVLVDLAEDLDVPLDALERLTPVVTGYLLGYVAAMPLLGQLSDRFGRKPLIHGCLAAFAIGSVMTAAAGDLPLVIAGRFLQGIAGGALLPVTMALAADLWVGPRRSYALGAVGAAQEFGAVIGPLYGVGLAALLGWRGIFWVNAVVAVAAAVAVTIALPDTPPARRAPVDWLGGGLLAIGLAALTVGLYNPDPGAGPLPAWGLPLVAGGVLVLGCFLALRLRSGGALRAAAGALGVSFAAGAALLVTLVNVELFAQGLLGLSATNATLLLTRFMLALPIGAVVGGMLARRVPDWFVIASGLAAAAVAYWLISRWTLDVEAARYGPFARTDLDLALAGLGLGLIIAPVSAAALRAIPNRRHGAASAAIVVSRTMGMLIGVAALSAWGFYRYEELTAGLELPLPFGISADEFNERLAAYRAAIEAALLVEFREIFVGASAVCLVGAVVAVTAVRHAAGSAGSIGPTQAPLESVRKPV